jgi:4-carboxymuconolactone decarboxylase
MKIHDMLCVFLLTVAVMMTAPLEAQDRLPAIPAGKMTDAQRAAVKEFEDIRKAELSGPFVPLARSPELLSRTRALGDYLRFKSALPPRLSEFVILLTARQWTQTYEWAVHQPIAVRAGVTVETTTAIAEGRRPEHMTEEEDILYDFCIELHGHHSVSDRTYARALAKFGEQGIVDTLGINGYYTLLAMVLNTARTPSGTSAPTLAPFPR